MSMGRSTKAAARPKIEKGQRVRKRGYLFVGTVAGFTVAGWVKVDWDEKPGSVGPTHCDPNELELETGR